MEVDSNQITHFANFLKRVYITCCMDDIVNDIQYNENDFMNSSKLFFERVYDKSELYDEEDKTLYTIYIRLSENKGTDSDIPLLYEILKYEILLKMNIFSKIENLYEDLFYDKLDEITSHIFRYIQKHIPSLSYIQYWQQCIH